MPFPDDDAVFENVTVTGTFQTGEPPDPRIEIVVDPVEGPIIELYTADPAEAGPGYMQAYISGAGGTRNLVTEIGAPNFTVPEARLVLVSASQDGTEEALIEAHGQGGLHAMGGIMAGDPGGSLNHPVFSVWSVTGLLNGAGNLALAGTPITSTNVLMLHGRWTDAGGNSSEFGGGLIVNNAGLIGNFGAPGGANRPYRVTAMFLV